MIQSKVLKQYIKKLNESLESDYEYLNRICDENECICLQDSSENDDKCIASIAARALEESDEILSDARSKIESLINKK